MGGNKQDDLAKIYASEVIPYILLLFLMTENYGLFGAAIACSIRLIIDSILIIIKLNKFKEFIRLGSGWFGVIIILNTLLSFHLYVEKLK